MEQITRWLISLSAILITEYTIPFLFLAFMLKCLLLSLYFLLLYWGICVIKRIWGHKMSVRANYYSWYALLLAFPLSGLEINNRFKLPLYDLFLGIYHFPTLDPEEYVRYIRIALLMWLILLMVIVIWFLAVLVKCLRQIGTNIWLQRAIHRQKAFDDREGLKQKAAQAFGLRLEKIQVVAADFVRSPVSYGVVRKTILLPHDYESRYSLPEQSMLLLHEMAHIKNHDTIKLQLLDIAACFIWPVRLMKKHFIRDSEILCDNRVLGVRQGEQDLYGELIVRECSAQKAVRGLGFSDSFYTVKSRLNAIYSRSPERHRIAVFAVAMALVMVGTGIYASQHQAAWLKTHTEEDAAFQPEEEFNILVRYEDEEGYNGLSYFMPNTFPLFMEISDMDTINRVTSGTYSYADGQLLVDKVALYAYLRPYIEEGLVVTEVSYINAHFPVC